MSNNINNLHSLLGGKWMITDEFANSLTPYLISILTKGELSFSGDFQNETPFFFLSRSGNITSDSSSSEEQQIAFLNIKGPILKYSQPCGPMGTRDMMSMMEKWKTQDHIVGVFQDYDTAGGMVAGTAQFAEYIYEYRKIKPVIGYTDGDIASAGYYLASACSKVVANKHAMAIGSLGTMHKSIDTDGIIEKLGGKVYEVYAEDSTHKNHASRELRNGNDQILIKEELNPLNRKFHSDIISYRPSIHSEALNGKHTYDIEKAKELGLIDAIGDKQYAINLLFELAEQNNQNQNNPDMSKENKKFDQIAAVIGQEDLQLSSKILSGKKGVFLTEAQLDDLEQKLEGHDAALKSEKDIIATKIVTINTLEATVTSIQGSVTDALATADLEAGEDTEASVKLLGEKVKEYGAQPGATGTTVISGGDRNPEEQDTIVNSNDGHNQLYKSL
ncbi:S49 family peptidase [Aquimarina algiphila]|uniref:S49 family peptidase n=1 Tax=Aquimarina algiphila TaxID=2047982 RepID=UPI00232C0231|nr:S49 family peptidase [Aquimarina algiphila]